WLLCLCECCVAHRHRRALPTRRSSDLSLARMFRAAVERNASGLFLAEREGDGPWRRVTYEEARRIVDGLAQGLLDRGLTAERPRSEEHTSELQSREKLVCRLLLEKKKV